MLIVTVFDEENLNHVEAAIYDAKIPSITPHRRDTRTLRIPVPKPTLDSRLSVVTAAAKKAEDTRVQCRKLHQASIKKGKYEKCRLNWRCFRICLATMLPRSTKLWRT
ncbi:hypothetical protein EDD85DRAFT_850921 [Armillaria nabsnona]|nr:hypothetical protein EDD85DRAFT_850921 [Armillaria nabsnona]